MKATVKYAVILLLSVWKLNAQEAYRIEPLPFSTSHANEVAAVACGSGVIYCSDRNARILVNYTDTANQPILRLYYTEKKDHSWSTPQILSKNLTSGAHEGPATVSVDGRELYYTVSNENGVGIYVAGRQDDGWGSVRPFVHNRKQYRVVHPSLSRDGKYLFFASDMPGGQGGFDIYYCERTSAGWDTPVNAGTEINSNLDELYPFIRADGVLFFSSYGHRSSGGLDIFSSTRINGAWNTCVRLEAPVNSPDNDFAYFSDDLGNTGYFSTDRRKTVDIYSFQNLFPVFDNCVAQQENYYGYIFEDPGAIDIDTTSFLYEWNLGDGTVVQGKTVEHEYAGPGTYFVHLDVIDSLTGERFEREASMLLEVTDIEQPYITANDTIAAGVSCLFDAGKTNLPHLDIERFYWLFGDGTRAEGESVSHSFSEPGIYQVILGVIGTSKETGEQQKACVFKKITVSRN